MNGWAEVIGVLVSIIGLLVWGTKYLIKDWFNKAEELEGLKKKHADKIQSRLEDELTMLRAIVSAMQETIKSLTTKLDRADIRIDHLVTEINKVTRMMEDFQSHSSDKIKNMIKTEVVELTKQINLIRNKKTQ